MSCFITLHQGRHLVNICWFLPLLSSLIKTQGVGFVCNPEHKQLRVRRVIPVHRHAQSVSAAGSKADWVSPSTKLTPVTCASHQTCEEELGSVSPDDSLSPQNLHKLNPDKTPSVEEDRWVWLAEEPLSSGCCWDREG